MRSIWKQLFELFHVHCKLLRSNYQPEYCQNPNLTTTQPQPNLNLVGFDTIITLHHPPPHPTPQELYFYHKEWP